MTQPTSLSAALMSALSSVRFDLHDEKACQSDIEQLLRPLFPSLVREARLDRYDIPDFMVEGVVIEVKMNRQSPAAILSQLKRYARHDRVAEIILATNRAVSFASTLDGKPLHVVSLGRAHL